MQQEWYLYQIFTAVYTHATYSKLILTFIGVSMDTTCHYVQIALLKHICSYVTLIYTGYTVT